MCLLNVMLFLIYGCKSSKYFAKLFGFCRNSKKKPEKSGFSTFNATKRFS